jgi:hypothetical protein
MPVRPVRATNQISIDRDAVYFGIGNIGSPLPVTLGERIAPASEYCTSNMLHTISEAF